MAITTVGTMNMATTQLPRIAIASGDPAGIGPEISLKAALDTQVRRICRPLVVGDPMVLETPPAPPESKHRFMSSPRRRPPIGRAMPSTLWPSRCQGERKRNSLPMTPRAAHPSSSQLLILSPSEFAVE
jgi:hypothetical protein